MKTVSWPGKWVFGFLFVIVCSYLFTNHLPLADSKPPAIDAKKPETKKEQPIHILVPDLFGGEDAVVKRLQKLNFKVTVQHWSKVDPDRLELIDVIFMPTQWAQEGQPYQHFESKKKAFHDFVKRGGGLLVCQPNPAQTCTPSLLPYPITFKNSYDDKDPTRINLDPDHYITEDLPGKDMPFPADPMIKVDSHYKVLAKQKSTNWPSLAVCSFGDGRVVVQTANENYAATIPIGDEILRRMIVWAAGKEPTKRQLRK